MSDGSWEPQDQADDHDRGAVVGRPLVEPGGDPTLRGVLIAEFEGDRIRRFRQYWNEVELLDGLGLLPA
jgi:hypothetical protein